MSILRVANVQFNASGTRRIDYDSVADDGIIKVSAAAVKLPVGDNASRPASQAGMIRYNSDTGYVEFGSAAGWVAVASNAAFDVANAAFASQNADYSSSNAAYGTANAAYGFSNSAYASINSNWTVTNTVYGVANAAFASANLVYANANTRLANATGTLAGALTTTGTITANSYLYVTPSDGINEGGEIQLLGAGSYTGWSIDSYMNAYRVFAKTGVAQANLHFFHGSGGTVKMGVNRTDPTYTLDVAGTINASSRGITTSSMPAGCVLQVQHMNYDSNFYINNLANSGNGQDASGWSLSITPTSATSKILVMVQATVMLSCDGRTRLKRNGTIVRDHVTGSNRNASSEWLDDVHGAFVGCYLDSPATTSTVTYQINLYATGCGSEAYVNRSTTGSADNAFSGLTLMEIAQ
jgi:hypothetical protein